VCASVRKGKKSKGICVRKGERGARVFLCVCVRMKERERKREFVRERVREREGERDYSKTLCECVREKD
jgi:hypothetical protein